MSKNDYYQKPEFDVKIDNKLLPYGISNRTGEEQIPKYIVIHEVSLGIGRSPESYNMDYYASKILQEGLNGSTIGYHFLVGDKKIYQFIKENERTDHTGTYEGNRNSIGVERIICEGVNYEYALHNQAKLIASLMLKWNIPIENVITHRKMQSMYQSKTRSYKLYTENARKILTDDKKASFLTSFLEQIKINENILKLIIDSESELVKTISMTNQLNNSNMAINKAKELLETFDQLSEQRQYLELYNLINLETQLSRIYCKLNNLEYTPLEKEINGILFIENLKAKDCPNRLVVGQRGGLVKFYREIKKCLDNNILFEELFDNPNAYPNKK